jgi:hypothetical protein
MFWRTSEQTRLIEERVTGVRWESQERDHKILEEVRAIKDYLGIDFVTTPEKKEMVKRKKKK